MRTDDIPHDFPDKDSMCPDDSEWVNPGDSIVVAPGGDIVVGPLRNEQGILYAEIDNHRCAVAKRALDIVGHYARPGVFQLHVDTTAQTPVVFDQRDG